MRSALLLILLAPLAGGCGTGDGLRMKEVASKGPPSSARFAEATTYLIEGELQLDTIEGAFDWSESEGWAEMRYANDSVWWRQVDGTCSQRTAAEDWQRVPTDSEGNCGLAAMRNDPTKTFALVRRLAGVEKVGEEAIDGEPTTRYRATWRDAGKGPLELWVDEAEVVRRAQYGGGRDSSSTTIDYFDFGVEVDVDKPLRTNFIPPEPVPNREDASQ